VLGEAELGAFLELLAIKRERPSVPFLRRLQRRCLTTVPFENLDIHWRVPIPFDLRRAWEKIVLRRRGGYCYELNGLFGWVLERLGFDVALLSGKVWRKPTRSWGPEYDHMALHVRIGGGDYLADVGYGDSFRTPLPLPSAERSDVSGAYRLSPEGGELQLDHSTVPGHWRPLYRVSLRPRAWSEFAGMFHWHQTHPDSPFTNHTVFTLARPWGRSTVTERYRMETRGGNTVRYRYRHEGQWLEELRTRFGVKGPLGPVGA
jgi:N-hydroxyarylamine O-acetyltransferase